MPTKRKALSTTKQIKALKPEPSSYNHNIKDSRGLYIKVLPSGRRGWFYRYRCEKQNSKGELVSAFEWMKIGDFTDRPGGMSLSEARDEVNRQRQIVREHGSAKEYRNDRRSKNLEKLRERDTQSEQDAYTVEVMIGEYIEEASRELKSWAEVDRALKRNVVAVIGHLPAHAVTRKDIIATLDRLNKRGKLVQANRVLAYTRRVFNWAINKDKFDVRNPCDRIEMNKEHSKERALSKSEIKRFITNLPKSGLPEVLQDLFTFILLTGTRPGEAARATLDRIDEDAATLTLEDTKKF